MNNRIPMRLLLVAALIATAVGAVVLATTYSQPASFGWFAYAPLSSETFAGEGIHIISTQVIAGTAILVIGLLALAFWAGLRLGYRKQLGNA